MLVASRHTLPATFFPVRRYCSIQLCTLYTPHAHTRTVTSDARGGAAGTSPYSGTRPSLPRPP